MVYSYSYIQNLYLKTLNSFWAILWIQNIALLMFQHTSWSISTVLESHFSSQNHMLSSNFKVPESIKRLEKITGKDIIFFHVDLRDKANLMRIFEQYEFSAVIHFAGLKSVTQSVSNPLEYYEVNLGGRSIVFPTHPLVPNSYDKHVKHEYTPQIWHIIRLSLQHVHCTLYRN